MRPHLFGHLISFDEALERVLQGAIPIGRTERVPIAHADRRVIATDIVSPHDVPAFDRSAMDGYAVRAADLADAGADRPVTLTCTGSVFTGETPRQTVGPADCVAIGTGAPLPPGADAVVIVERTSREDDRVTVRAPVTPGQNISRRGADISQGSRLLASGDALGPARIGSLAAIGLTEVDVFARPSVAILSTGNEIVPPGQPLPPGHVYDVNRFTVSALTERHGGVPAPMSSAGDTLDALIAALDAAAAHDVIVFSGGSSVGERDLMLDALQARGEILFHGIAVKPGKPTLFGRIGRTPVFGMPGNPTSCLSNTYMLLVPFLRRVARLPPWRPMTVDAPLARAIVSNADRHQFFTVRLIDGRVEPAFKSSGDITSMAHADGYIEIPTTVRRLEAGAIVRVHVF
jgi:molybdenum cofactor synthesis domain-containing protein